jgi:hypothetical protein
MPLGASPAEINSGVVSLWSEFSVDTRKCPVDDFVHVRRAFLELAVREAWEAGNDSIGDTCGCLFLDVGVNIGIPLTHQVYLYNLPRRVMPARQVIYSEDTVVALQQASVYLYHSSQALI